MVKLVGIVNVTPDSFSDGGKYLSHDSALHHIKQLFDEGAYMVDIGAESTRPGADKLTPAIEWGRLEALMHTLANSAYRLSIDTYHVQTVRKLLSVLPSFVLNDVTGLADPAMRVLLAESKIPCIISHLPGHVNGNIGSAHTTKLIDSEDQVVGELTERRDQLIALGYPAERIILDPGIGFGKTTELNWKLLSFAKHFPGEYVMIGYSRKRFLGEARLELETNLAAAKIAIESGAQYLRVHDVAGHLPLIKSYA